MIRAGWKAVVIGALGVAVALPAVPQATAIRAGRMIDGTGAPPVDDAVILVEGGRIRDAGAAVAIPSGVTVLDLSDRTVLPGFLDAHVHLVGRYVGEGENWQDAPVRDLPQADAIRGVRNAWLTLQAGFTTVRNVGAHDFSDVALRDLIREGVVPGPRMLVAGHSLGITGGHCDTNGFRPGLFEPSALRGIANGPVEVRAAVREQFKYGADGIKTCATGGVLSEGDAVGVQQYTFEELEAMVQEAGLHEKWVAAHAHGTEGIKVAIRAGVRSIEHGSMLDAEAIQLFRDHGTWLVPTLMAQEAVERQAAEGVLDGQRREKALFIAPRARASFRLAVEGGVRVALGTDAGVFPHGHNAREFVLMVENGMQPMAALIAGTSSAAELLGLGDEVGAIRPGLSADLVALDGDPLRDIEATGRVVFVMLAGTVVRDDR